MYQIKTESEFINAVREIDETLINIRLSKIEVDKAKKDITYHFICDKTVNGELNEKILKEAEKITSPVFSEVHTVVHKIVSNDELIDSDIYKYLKDNFPSISIFLKPTDVISKVEGNVVNYVLRLTEDGVIYVKKNNTIQKLNDYLKTKFCSDFFGATEIKEEEETVSLLDEDVMESELKKVDYRTFKVSDIVVIDDATMENNALYVEDAKDGVVTVAGKVNSVSERQTKGDNPKPFFIFYLEDFTGRISGIYFPRKNTLDKIRDIKEGDEIIVKGVISHNEKGRSFKIERINRCTLPKEFEKKDKYKNPVPKNYTYVFPEKCETLKVTSVFDEDEVLPKELTENTYVVFDFETTGLDPMRSGITEIGAVKIVNGKMTEHFTTLVKPDYHISDEIVAKTGISDELVKDAPKISTVFPDFIKFIDGAILVGHNSYDFDMKFVKKYAVSEEYEVKNKAMDTMVMARELLPSLRHVDLHTVAEYFDIVFHHHRALSDSYATAEIFINLMKIKYNK